MIYCSSFASVSSVKFWLSRFLLFSARIFFYPLYQFSQKLISLEDILLRGLFSEIHIVISGEINHTLSYVLYKFYLGNLQAQWLSLWKRVPVLLVHSEDKGEAQKRAGDIGGISFVCPQHQCAFIIPLCNWLLADCAQQTKPGSENMMLLHTVQLFLIRIPLGSEYGYFKS